MLMLENKQNGWGPYSLWTMPRTMPKRCPLWWSQTCQGRAACRTRHAGRTWRCLHCTPPHQPSTLHRLYTLSCRQRMLTGPHFFLRHIWNDYHDSRHSVPDVRNRHVTKVTVPDVRITAERSRPVFRCIAISLGIQTSSSIFFWDFLCCFISGLVPCCSKCSRDKVNRSFVEIFWLSTSRCYGRFPKQGRTRIVMANQPAPLLTYPPQKKWINKALLRETNG